MLRGACGRRQGACGMEGLEGRALLAADLTVGVGGYVLTAGAKAGGAIAGTASIVVTNRGPGAVSRGAKGIEVDVYLRAAGQVSGGVLIGVRRGVNVGGLAKGKSVGVGVPLALAGAKVTAGTFSVVAVVDARNVVAEAKEGNNRGVAGVKYVVGTPVAKGNLKIGQAVTTLTQPGVAGTGSAVVSNAGGVAVTGRVDVVFEAKPNRSFVPTITLGRRSGGAVNLGPGGTVAVTGVTLSAVPVNQLTGDVTYAVTARLVTTNVRPADGNAADNVAPAGSVVAPGKTITNPLEKAGLGTRLAFAEGTTTDGVIGLYQYVDGAVGDGAGHLGTYRVRTAYANHPAELTLNFPAQLESKGFVGTFVMTPVGAATFLPAGRTLVFSESAVAAVAKLVAGDGGVYYLVAIV